MDESVTQHLILRYIYGETGPAEDLKVRGILSSNSEMMSYYKDAMEIKAQLNDAMEEPHPTSVSIICEHSHNSHTEAV
ncbi:MAG: hypothetical protein KG003_04820 [Bacteroidetes bacterium]|nr:hypothetical protein [Bacteroidota bacterium]